MSNSAQAAGTRGGAGRRRSVARLLAVQALYQIELNKIEASGGAGVDAAILRAGAYELLGRTDVPPRVVISEYLDVAHAFFAGKEPGMVNGVLDRLARVLRPGDFDHDPGPDGGGRLPPR